MKSTNSMEIVWIEACLVCVMPKRVWRRVFWVSHVMRAEQQKSRAAYKWARKSATLGELWFPHAQERIRQTIRKICLVFPNAESHAHIIFSSEDCILSFAKNLVPLLRLHCVPSRDLLLICRTVWRNMKFFSTFPRRYRQTLISPCSRI